MQDSRFVDHKSCVSINLVLYVAYFRIYQSSKSKPSPMEKDGWANVVGIRRNTFYTGL